MLGKLPDAGDHRDAISLTICASGENGSGLLDRSDQGRLQLFVKGVIQTVVRNVLAASCHLFDFARRVGPLFDRLRKAWQDDSSNEFLSVATVIWRDAIHHLRILHRFDELF